ncbi:hypothetical protein WDU94_008812 [Cyamophila willieti]
MGGVGTPVDQQFALRWNDFQSSILSSFRHLRDEEDFVDVTLACDGCSFTAHKVVLSACSPYFKTLLKVSHKLFSFQLISLIECSLCSVLIFQANQKGVLQGSPMFPNLLFTYFFNFFLNSYSIVFFFF